MDLFDIDKVLDELEAAENVVTADQVLSSGSTMIEEEPESATSILHPVENLTSEQSSPPPLISLSPDDEPALPNFSSIQSENVSDLLEVNFEQTYLPASQDQRKESTGSESFDHPISRSLLQEDQCLIGNNQEKSVNITNDNQFITDDTQSALVEESQLDLMVDLNEVVAPFVYSNDQVTEADLDVYLSDLETGNTSENRSIEAENGALEISDQLDPDESADRDAGATSDQSIETWASCPTLSLQVTGVREHSPIQPDYIEDLEHCTPVEEAGEAQECYNDQEEQEDEADEDYVVPATVISVIDSVSDSRPIRQLVTVTPVDEPPPDWKPTESEMQLGLVQPVWIPDQDSLICMLCEARFTVIKRRHHCRACGRVLCADCCHLKVKLPYVDKKPSRVCNSCSLRLQKITEYRSKNTPSAEIVPSGGSPAIAASQVVPPDPADPIQPLCSSQLTGSGPDTVNSKAFGVSPDREPDQGPPDPVPLATQSFTSRTNPQGVLKQGSKARESKSVMFCDGVKPGAEHAMDPVRTKLRPGKKPQSDLSPRQRELESFIGSSGQYLIRKSDVSEEWQTWEEVYNLSNKPGDESPLIKLALKRNLTVIYSLCQNNATSSPWPINAKFCAFASDGLKNVCTDELFLAVACQVDGNDDFSSNYSNSLKIIIDDILRFFDNLYDSVLAGKFLTDTSCGLLDLPAGSTFLGSNDLAGFLYFRPTFQCLKKLYLPDQPYLIGLLIKNDELPWAKVLPLRLLLRLGVEFKTYPWPIISDPKRKSVLNCGGHTIMNIINDFRNFTYSIACVTRSSITLEENNLIIVLPNDQVDQVKKIVQSSNEHVLAFGGSFCRSADSHLVCVQNEAGSYASQTVGKSDHPIRKVTGCTFVIFNASLKVPGPKLRISIVEDGVMVQIKPDMMERLRCKLLAAEEISLSEASEPSVLPTSREEANNEAEQVGATIPVASSSTTVQIKWTDADRTDLKIHSAVDCLWLGDVTRFRLAGRSIEISNAHSMIRLISIFALPASTDNDTSFFWEPPEDFYLVVKRVTVSLATCVLGKANKLIGDLKFRSIGVRIAWGLDTVEYCVGFDGNPVPGAFASTMDDYLVPILGAIGQNAPMSNPARIELLLRLLRL